MGAVVPAPAPAGGGGKDGESTIAGAGGGGGGGVAADGLRSSTVSLVGSDLGAVRRASAPSRGPSWFARVRGGATGRASLNFESFCRRAGVGAVVGGAGAGAGAGTGRGPVVAAEEAGGDLGGAP